MPSKYLKYFLVLYILLDYSCDDRTANFQIYDLKQNRSTEISKLVPTSFSWKIKAEQNNWLQEAYQIIVSGSEKMINENIGDMWDSGKTLSPDQLFIVYKGNPLVGGEKYFWKVRVWQKNKGKASWSQTSGFRATLRYPDDWKAKWISSDYKKESPLPIFRKTFQLKQVRKAKSATLYICGLGYYEVYLNGSKIGDRVLEPAQTNYDDYSFYSAYDIPLKNLSQQNVLGVMLGNGWYNQYQVWTSAMAYGQPIVIAQLVIEYENGTSEMVCTDDTWKWMNGPITSTNIYAGENYDARLEVPDWSSPSVNDGNWNKTILASNFPPKLSEQVMEPIRSMERIPVLQVSESSPGIWIFDFGQNFAGWSRLKINGNKGQKITLRFAEEIDQKGQLDPTSTGVSATKVVQTDSYTCKGEGTEIWEPRFTYHGFRYVEVTGLTAKPENDFLTGMVVYSSMAKAGNFTCSDLQINRLHNLALWTIKSNMHGIPTDCPHRERCGWTGDAHIVAMSLIQNLDARLFLTKYLYDMRSSGRLEKEELYFGLNFQDRSIVTKPAGIPTMIVPGRRTSGIASPDWGTAAVQIPWLLYLYYGDINELREFYPDMKNWVEYISKKFPEGIVNHGLGDWCPPGGNEKIDCPVPVSSTAFHYLDLTILTKTAYLLGYQTDASYYSKRLNKVKEQFNKHFFDAERKTYGSQTANVMAINMGLVPEGATREVVKSLVNDITTKSNGFIQTGIFGLGRIFPALTENGAEDSAFKLFTKTGNHSFAHMWDNYNVTTLWEVLPVDDELSREVLNGRSHSHPMNSGYDEWFFRGIAGIHPDEKSPGFKKVVFRPYFTSRLINAQATYESPYGTISSNWKWEGKCFVWNIQIPANTGSDLYIPKLFGKQNLSVNGKNEQFDLSEDPSIPGFFLCKSFGSGSYILNITDAISDK